MFSSYTYIYLMRDSSVLRSGTVCYGIHKRPFESLEQMILEWLCYFRLWSSWTAYWTLKGGRACICGFILNAGYISPSYRSNETPSLRRGTATRPFLANGHTNDTIEDSSEGLKKLISDSYTASYERSNEYSIRIQQFASKFKRLWASASR